MAMIDALDVSVALDVASLTKILKNLISFKLSLSWSYFSLIETRHLVYLPFAFQFIYGIKKTFKHKYLKYVRIREWSIQRSRSR